MSVQPLHPVTFDAWRVAGGKAHPIVKNAVSDEQWRSLSTTCQHKEQVIVVERMSCGKTLQHVFQVREKAATYRYNPETKQPERFKPRFLDLLFSVEIAAFSPVEPWAWTPGADVVGHVHSSVIEGRAA